MGRDLPLMPEQNPWRLIRWNSGNNVDGVGATGTTMLFSQPGVLYLAQTEAYTAQGRMHLYDHTNRPQNPVAVLTPAPAAPDNLPRLPRVGIPLNLGLYVSYSMGTGGMTIFGGWERGT